MIPTDYLRRHIAKGGQLSEARWEFLKEKKGFKEKKVRKKPRKQPGKKCLNILKSILDSDGFKTKRKSGLTERSSFKYQEKKTSAPIGAWKCYFPFF